MQRVLIAEDSFTVAMTGVIVLPPVRFEFFTGSLLPRLVELRFPDGSAVKAAAHFSIPRRTPPTTEYEFVCQLPNLKRAVPAGTEIWAELEPAKD